MNRLPATICTLLLLGACGRSDLLPRRAGVAGGFAAQDGRTSGGAAGNGGTAGSPGTKATGAGGQSTTPGTDCSTICDGTCVDIQTDNRNCGGCGIVCAAVAPSAAACMNGRCLVTLAAGQIEPAYPAVDATSVYWTTQSSWTGNVMRVPLEGGAPTTLASDQSGPSSLVVNATGVYWALFSNHRIEKAPLEGGAPTTLASGITYLFRFVVDATNLYWALDAGTDSSVVKMPLGGGPQTTLATEYHGGARAIAMDATSVYWTDVGGPGDESSVYKVSLEGGTVTTLASGQGIAGGLALDATSVYWTVWRSETDSVLMRIPKTGGSPVAVVSGPDGNFAVDEANAYWTVDSAVMKVPLTGGTPATLASGQLIPTHIVVDATSVYWTNTGSQPMRATDGAVMKVSPK